MSPATVMKIRAVVLGLVFAAGLLHPRRLEADKFKPGDPRAGGILAEDATCPAATHVLLSFCDRIPLHYLVFNRMKGVKHYLGRTVVVSGPVDTVSCSLPLTDVRKIALAPEMPPPPCP